MLIPSTVASGTLYSFLVPGLRETAVSEAVSHSGLVTSISFISTSIMFEIATESLARGFLSYCVLNVTGGGT